MFRARERLEPPRLPLGELQDGGTSAHSASFRLVVRFVRRNILFYDEGVADLPDRLPRYMLG
jgi:hypothetical protein